MTQRPGIAFSHDFALRGRTLAERRLDHLTELYDSGRWKRYYNESEFLLNVREARAALETWRRLELAGPTDRWQADISPLRFDEQIQMSLEHASGGASRSTIMLAKNLAEQKTSAKYDTVTKQGMLDLSSQRPSLLPSIMFSTDGVGSERDLGET